MILLYALLAWQPGADVEPQAAFEAAVATIEHQHQTIGRFRLAFRLQANAKSLRGKPQINEYRETREEPKYLTELISTTGIGKDVDRHEQHNSFDGQEYRGYVRAEKSGSRGTEPGFNCSYLGYLFGERPLIELVRQTPALVQWTTIDGRRLLECRFEEDRQLIRTLFLDPEFAWQPRRMLTVQTIPRDTYADGRTSGELLVTIKEFLRQNGIVCPSRTELLYDAVLEGGQRERQNTRVIELTSLEINPELGGDAFTIKFPDGTRVKDKIHEVVYIEGQPGSERPLSQANQDGNDAPLVTVTGAAWIWWADYRVWVALSAVLLLSIGGFAWYERRAV